VDACRERGVAGLLLVCEETSRSGRAFVASTGATYRNAEYRLRFVRAPDAARVPTSALADHDAALRLDAAGPSDAHLLASIIATSFGHTMEAEWQRVAADLRRPTHRFFIARAGARPVGSLGVVTAGGRTFIVAMGVRRECRGRGHGRQMLEATLAMLLAERRSDIYIEVDAENVVALSLYRSCGFRETTRYEFFRLSIP
jgi:ribosomal protein S18 acetylase RimI-like enzyme